MGRNVKIVTAREFNQDISRAKRFAALEPVFVTDRGKPTHVLLGIAAYRELVGEQATILDLIGATADAQPLVLPDQIGGLQRQMGR